MNLKFYTSILCILFIINISVGQYLNIKKTFELKGYTKVKKDGTKIFLTYSDQYSNQLYDSTVIQDNTFRFKGVINCPTAAIISYTNDFLLDGINTAHIFLEPRKMLLNLESSDFTDLKLVGSTTQNDYQYLEKKKYPTYLKRDSILKIFKINYNELKNTIDSSRIRLLQERIEELDSLIYELINEEIKLEFDFIRTNPTSFISLDKLTYRAKRKEGAQLYDTIWRLFNGLSYSLKISPQGKNLRKILFAIKSSQIGSLAPNFSQHDINNNVLSLSSFRGIKYILLDFWASWCSPCRDDASFLKEEYGKYSVLGFEIIGVSIDADSSRWRKAIYEDETQIWKHLIDKKNYPKSNNKTSISTDYAVSAIPVKILIDKQGVIIGRWRGGGNKNREEIEKALENIFYR